MHESKKQVSNLSYNQDDGVFSNSLVLLMFSGFGIVILVFSLFLLFNVFVKQTLSKNDIEISSLLGIKQTQEDSIAGLSKKLNLTDKDLKDRIKTNKYLNSNLAKEKKQKESFKENLDDLSMQHSKTVKHFESSEKTTKELFLELEMEKEQHIILQSKYNVLTGEYDAKLKESEALSMSLQEEKDKRKNLNSKYMENIDYIEKIEENNKDILEQNQLKDQLNRQLKEKIEALQFDSNYLTVPDINP
jgi:hypothetical protein